MGNAQLVPSHVVEKRLQALGDKRGKELVENTKNCKLVARDMMEAGNRFDSKRQKGLLSSDAVFAVADAETEMPFDAVLDEVGRLFRGFPDRVQTYESIKEIRPGVVKVSNYYSRGTHKDDFGLGAFPEIPATGIVVDDGPCALVCYMNNKGKMTKMEMVEDKAVMDLVGLANYYVQVGGKLEMPDDDASSNTSGSTRSVKSSA